MVKDESVGMRDKLSTIFDFVLADIVDRLGNSGLSLQALRIFDDQITLVNGLNEYELEDVNGNPVARDKVVAVWADDDTWRGPLTKARLDWLEGKIRYTQTTAGNQQPTHWAVSVNKDDTTKIKLWPTPDAATAALVPPKVWSLAFHTALGDGDDIVELKRKHFLTIAYGMYLQGASFSPNAPLDFQNASNRYEMGINQIINDAAAEPGIIRQLRYMGLDRPAGTARYFNPGGLNPFNWS